MHFAILTQYYPPEIGAPQQRHSELAQRMVHRGHAVTVLTAMPNYPGGKIYPGYGGMLHQELREGVRVIRTFIYPTKSTNFALRLASQSSFLGSSASLGSLLLKHPDYLLVESPPLILGLSAFWLSLLKRTRLIFNVADLWPGCFVTMGIWGSGDLRFRLGSWLEAFCYRQAWLVTGQTKGILTDISGRFPDLRTYYLPNGADTEVFGADRRSEATRMMLADNGDCVALYAGLHGLAQGLDQVLDAAEMLRNEAGIRFVLVGDGPEKESLMRHAARQDLINVQFLEKRPYHEIPPLLASADVALVVLKTQMPEAVPTKLYEAMASGRPVVLVAGGEAAEIVRENKAGIIVDPGDVAGLAQAMLTLRERSGLRHELGANGRRLVEQIFDRKEIVTRFIDYMEENL